MKIVHITVLANGHGLVTYSDGTIETVHSDDVTIVEPTEVPVETVVIDYIK